MLSSNKKCTNALEMSRIDVKDLKLLHDFVKKGCFKARENNIFELLAYMLPSPSFSSSSHLTELDANLAGGVQV